jgi:hypothetical protein
VQSVKVRLGIIGLIVLVALIGKWGLGNGEDKDSSSASPSKDSDKSTRIALTDPRSEIEASIDDSGTDSLVPPAPISGVSHSILTTSLHVSADDRAVFEPHGEQVCASGCAVSRHPTEELTTHQFHQLLNQFAEQPISEDSNALETLLFFGRQTSELIDKQGTGSLDPWRAEFLRAELLQAHAKISIRVVDENGTVRTSLPPTRVPLDRRHVFSMDVNNVQPLVTSGTVKRVGLYHLWTRL